MTADTSITANAVRLVLGVARLGENDLRGWWKGHALDRTGQYVLSGMFPRTWRAAAMELDIMAATRMHDELLGRSSALHLFSSTLPFGRWARAWLAEEKTAPDDDPLLSTLQGWTEDDAADHLREWCGGVEPRTSEPLGDGLLVGRLTASEIDDDATLLGTVRLLTMAYLDQTGSLRAPYFDLAR